MTLVLMGMAAWAGPAVMVVPAGTAVRPVPG
jgi:hypothetical protein